MEPRIDEPDFTLYVGEALAVLATLPDASVDCILTSPPYWNLRDYGTAEWDGGDPACDHLGAGALNHGFNERYGNSPGARKQEERARRPYLASCGKCGAVRVDQQLGLEPVHDCAGWATGEPCGACYVCKLVAVAAECRRVLAPHGTFWLNLGDSYASKARGSDVGWEKSRLSNPGGAQKAQAASLRQNGERHGKAAGLKEKDLCGIPWRVALALQADGWWLRNDNIWCLSGGTRLYARTAKGDGPAALKDLVRLAPSTVHLWNGDRWTQVVSWVPSPEPRGEPLEIELASGERVGCTPGHVWPTDRGDLRADELQVGDVIRTTQLPEPDAPAAPSALPDKTVGWLIGRYLADGSYSGETIQIACHRREAEALAARVRVVAESLHGSAAVHYTGESKATVNLNGPLLAPLIRMYVHGTNARTKGLRFRVWRRSNVFLRALLDGYLEGDGHYDAANERWRLGFTRNARLASDLRTVAARLGLPLRLAATTQTGFGRAWPTYRGQIRVTPTKHPGAAWYGQVTAVRRSRGQKFWDVEVADEPHLFALASGVLTHNSKGNPMPDSVTDRANVSHEYMFMLARNDRPLYWTHDVTGAWADGKPAADYWWFPPPELAHLEPARDEPSVADGEAPWRRRNAWRGHAYWYDGEAVKEAAKMRPQQRLTPRADHPKGDAGRPPHRQPEGGIGYLTRTARTVWEINTEPYPRAHFAVFPQRLVRRALRAGCPREVCTVCGLPRERIVKKGKPVLQADTWTANGAASYEEDAGGYVGASAHSTLKHVVPTTTVGWTDCGHGSYRPGIVLDPFLGSGTVVAVARQELRHTIGIELNPAYVPFIVERAAAWRTGRPAPPPAVNDDQMSLAVE